MSDVIQLPELPFRASNRGLIMAKKFELTTNTKMHLGTKLFQIRALISFGDVEAGELGGWVEKEESVDQGGNAWVSGNAQVYGNARVSGNAQVYDAAQVFGNAQVFGDAWVFGNAWVLGNAWVYGDARVSGNAWVFGDARVFGDADLMWFSKVGSEFGTLTAKRSKDGGIIISSDCFFGTLDEFAAAVESRHGASQIGEEYRLLIQFIRHRMGVAAEVTSAAIRKAKGE